MGFFEEISKTFSTKTTTKCKQLMNLNKKLANMRNRKIFLLQCRSKNIIPRHITQSFTCVSNLLTGIHPYVNKADKAQRKFQKSVLNLEIEICCWNCNNFMKQIGELKFQLENELQSETFRGFEKRLSESFEAVFLKVKNTNIKKIEELENRQNNLSSDAQNTKFLYNYIQEVEIPENVKKTLALGPKYGLPLMKSDISIPTLIKDLEYVIHNYDCNEEERDILRMNCINCITNFKNNPNNFAKEKNIVLKDFKATQKFLKSHPEIMVTKSDKGNSVVIMLKEEYTTEVYKMLLEAEKPEEEKTYKLLKKDPTSKFKLLSNKLIDTISRETGDESLKFLKNNHP